MIRRNARYSTISAAAMLAIIGVKPAMGQSVVPAPAPNAPATGHNDGDIIVTAQRRSESIQKVPASITALSGQSLQDRGVTDAADLKFLVPNLQVGSYAGQTNVAIRGIAGNLAAANGPQAVAIHVDGVYLPIPALGDLAQVDLARVEILRGPQGTLYGRNANAGVINFITAAPTDRLEGYLQAGYATYNDARMQGVLNVPLNSAIRVRAVIDYRHRNDGFIKNILPGGQDVEFGTSLFGRLRIVADVTPNLTLDLSASHVNSDGPQIYATLREPPNIVGTKANPILATAISTGQPFRFASNSPITGNKNYSLGVGTLTWDLGKFKLKSISGYQVYRDESYGDDDFSSASLLVPHRIFKDKTFTQELNVSGSAGPLDAVVGVFYMHENYNFFLHYELPNGLGVVPANGQLDFRQNPLRTRAVAGFTDLTLNLADRFRLIGGVRFARDRISVLQDNFVRFGPTTKIVTCGAKSAEIEYKSATPRVGAQFEFDQSSNMYATFSKGFKDGGFNRTACLQSFKPERVTAYEIGIKNRLFDNTVTINASAFYYNYTDLQLNQVVGISSMITNAATARVKGLEIEGVWQPDTHWTINANLSLLDAKYRNFTNVDSLDPTRGVQNLAGKKLNNAPSETFNFGVSYRTPPLGFGNLTFRADTSQRSRYYLREFNLPLDSQNGYVDANLSLIWDSPDKKYRVRLYGTNVTNAGYIVYLNAVDALGSRGITWGNPRQVGAEFRVGF